MTLLVAWVGIDTHGPGSMYIASDSRISWPSGVNFDQGRKVFAFANHPDILGYSGDVLFPSIALNQIVQLADAGLLFQPGATSKEKFETILRKLNHLSAAYPTLDTGLGKNSLSILHASREDNNGFFCRMITWSRAAGWRGHQVDLPNKSDVLFSRGSGAAEFNENYKRYQAGPSSGTTRSVFHCFCDTLNCAKDPGVGGAPQLVGLYRKPSSSAVQFGIIDRGSRYFLGAKIDDLRSLSHNIEWRNDNFELCDGKSMNKLENAQSQPDRLRRQ